MSNKIREFKLRKFDRDSKDYSSNRVYKFLKYNEDGSSSVLRKSVSWANPLELGLEYNTSDYDIDSASTSGDEFNRQARPFLDRKTKRNQRGNFVTRKRPSLRGQRRI